MTLRQSQWGFYKFLLRKTIKMLVIRIIKHKCDKSLYAIGRYFMGVNPVPF